MQMPVRRFYNMLKWKSELEEERSKLMQEKHNNSKHNKNKRVKDNGKYSRKIQ